MSTIKDAFYQKKKVIIIGAALVRNFSCCPFCKVAATLLVKNDKKTSMILLNRRVNKKTYLRLKKQRYH